VNETFKEVDKMSDTEELLVISNNVAESAIEQEVEFKEPQSGGETGRTIDLNAATNTFEDEKGNTWAQNTASGLMEMGSSDVAVTYPAATPSRGISKEPEGFSTTPARGFVESNEEEDEEESDDYSSEEEYRTNSPTRKVEPDMNGRLYQAASVKPLIKVGNTTVSMAQAKLFGIPMQNGKVVVPKKERIDPAILKAQQYRRNKIYAPRGPVKITIELDEDRELTFKPAGKLGHNPFGEQTSEQKMSFLEGTDAKELDRRRKLKNIIGKEDYEASLSRLSCSECGAYQSYDEYIDKRKICHRCNVEYKKNTCNFGAFEKREKLAQMKKQERLERVMHQSYDVNPFKARIPPVPPSDTEEALKEFFIKYDSSKVGKLKSMIERYEKTYGKLIGMEKLVEKVEETYGDTIAHVWQEIHQIKRPPLYSKPDVKADGKNGSDRDAKKVEYKPFIAQPMPKYPHGASRQPKLRIPVWETTPVRTVPDDKNNNSGYNKKQKPSNYKKKASVGKSKSADRSSSPIARQSKQATCKSTASNIKTTTVMSESKSIDINSNKLTIQDNDVDIWNIVDDDVNDDDNDNNNDPIRSKFHRLMQL
jgi:hypothetical protein